jgi:hypothetical protein
MNVHVIKVHLYDQESNASQANLRDSVYLDNVLHFPSACLSACLHGVANNTLPRVGSKNWV